ncbi:MAG: lysoplasmalogenase [Prolixibacteraceae bacterium]|nr:lysoplasmalogenase [Prolixibacteraceae bacterium]
MKTKISVILFLLISFADLVGEVCNVHILGIIAKPLIIPSLSLYFLRKTGKTAADRKSVLLALLFSWIGDIALMIHGDFFFLGGLLSFLTAHIFYISIFHTQRKRMAAKSCLAGKPWLFLPFALYGAVLYRIVFPNLSGILYLAVALYAAVILIMSLAALNRKNAGSNKSFRLVFIGSLLFVISDTLLAVNSFVHTFAHAGFLIMVTYIAAQALIVSGLTEMESEAPAGTGYV